MAIKFTPSKKIEFKPTQKTTVDFKPQKKKEISFKQEPAKINFKPYGGGGEDERWDKMTKFQKTLDVLGRPGYAVKSVLLEHQKRNKELFKDIPEGDTIARMKIMTKRKPEVRKDLEAAWRGFSGQERITANELWKNVDVEGVPFLGFASELAMDPLMWGGGAGYRAITKTMGGVAKVGLEGVKKIPGVTKAATAIIQKTQPVTSALREMFVTKTGIGKLNLLIEKYLTKREYVKGQELKYGIKVRNVIQNIANKYKISIQDIEKQIVNAIEQPRGISPSAPQEITALSNVIKSHLTNILTKEMKAGVPITALSKNARNIQYFPRITTKEAQQYLKQAKIGNTKIWNSKLANSLQRKTGDFTLEEFNAFVKANGLESLGGKSVEQFFMTKPAQAVATRGIRSAKAVTSAQFLDDVGKTFGSKTNPGYYEQLPEAVTKLNPGLKGKYFDPEVASEITRTTSQYINPQQAKIFMRTFDAIQNSWKKWTLAPFPKYHLRNMVGNLWNNHLAGVDAKNYPKAQAVQMYRKYKGKGNIMEKTALAELNKLGINPQMADDIIKQAEQTGVLGSGWYGADIETSIEKQIMGKKSFIERGMAFGSTIENNARLAHFIDKLDKGDDALTAAISVKKFLFDYQNLTAFEKQVMKRLFPFYTWTRKNMPLQLEQIWKQPQKYAPLTVPLKARDPQDLIRLKHVRPDLYDRLPVELRRTLDAVTYVPLEGLIPAGDLTKLAKPHEMLAELLTPYLRAPMELAMNKSFYFDAEIEKYPEETQELLRVDIPVKYKYALTTVIPQARLLNEINKIVKKQTRKEALTASEQAFSQSLSSIYKTNLKDLRDRALQKMEGKIKELENGMFWAKRNKREKEAKRIKETYDKVKAEIKRIKGR